MGKINKQFEAQQATITSLNSNFVRHAMDADARALYTCWGLQQCSLSLVPMPVTDIAPTIRKNGMENNGLFDGMLRHWPVGESSTGNKKGKASVDNKEKDKAWEPREEDLYDE
ncbi:hypothetical protein PIB30_072712 [Stylosanthes scabra]|uniref:Uncharacterized protein n=1 Tax=Stylosanthes scabra TaxID=79078 RepID=A0ABU6YN45_9FABA|nr:hypothetical protein [Stylosanthes scabra]